MLPGPAPAVHFVYSSPVNLINARDIERILFRVLKGVDIRAKAKPVSVLASGAKVGASNQTARQVLAKGAAKCKH